MLTFVLILSGLDFMTAFTARGRLHQQHRPRPQQGRAGHNYASCLTDFQTWVCSFAMLLGRLEVLRCSSCSRPASGASSVQLIAPCVAPLRQIG
jgi:trk system potassium uptake protein TrkH